MPGPETSKTASGIADDSGPGSRQPRVGAVSSAIAVLRLLGSERRGIGVNAIARQLAMQPSSCFNILKTLVSEEFVDFDPVSKYYTLGAGMLQIARLALDPLNVFEMIRSRADEIVEKWPVTVGLWRLRRDRMVLTGYATAGNQTMRIHLNVGYRLPLLIGAAGRCVAAVMGFDEAEIGQRLAKLRWKNAPELHEYLADVAQTKISGWALDRSRHIGGATSIATPVVSADGVMRYCLSATSFSGQLTDDELPMLADDIKGLAQWASGRLVAP